MQSKIDLCWSRARDGFLLLFQFSEEYVCISGAYVRFHTVTAGDYAEGGGACGIWSWVPMRLFSFSIK